MSWSEQGWRSGPPSRPPPLFPGQTHLWAAELPLDAAAEELPLHPQDRERLAGVTAGEAAERFRRLRGLLRLLIAGYTGRPAAEQRLVFGEHGKPALADGGLHFNLSHCRDLALFAFRPDAEVGVDVERADRLADRDGLARRYFHPAEIRWVAAQPDPADAFFAVWTAKEALLKAKGWGISRPLAEIDTSAAEAHGLRLRRLPLPAPWTACLAAPVGDDDPPLLFRLPPAAVAAKPGGDSP